MQWLSLRLNCQPRRFTPKGRKVSYKTNFGDESEKQLTLLEYLQLSVAPGSATRTI